MKRNKNKIDLGSDLTMFLNGDYGTPHNLLGMHYSKKNKAMRIVAFDPQADRIDVLYDNEKIKTLDLLDNNGVYGALFEDKKDFFSYRLEKYYGKNSFIAEDPYSFMPCIGDTDLHLFNEGKHLYIYNIMGAHYMVHQNVKGTRFVVWAPNAKRVSVVGNFNSWDGRRNPMRTMGSSGLWELFVPQLQPGEIYKYEIKAQNNDIFLKMDPYAQQTELRPRNAAVIAKNESFNWSDQQWMTKRHRTDILKTPVNIYEVHLGSWGGPGLRTLDPYNEDDFHSYREIAEPLADYVEKMGYTHVEFLPVAEHPLDQSWGYQITAFFAPTARHGSPEDFAFLVDYLHNRNIGVLLDWVPAHFPKDAFSLGRFDGTALYEHADPKQGEHSDWGTYIFNYGRNEVKNFLIGNALYWLDKFHIDGLRVDAVASMLYLDYSREEGEWIPNKYGGNENIEAINFIRELNTLTHQHFPGVMMIAEESTAWGGVSRPTYIGGLGFTFKWNMGWMHDSLKYFKDDAVFRSYHHNDLTFSMLYAFTENFILPLSHDEVVHGKGSLIERMSGTYEQKFANLRVLYGYMMTHPGKKLLFMGGEIAQWNEWNCKDTLDWNLLDYPIHNCLQHYVMAINNFYKENPALWEDDFTGNGFEWIEAGDAQQSVLSFVRWNKHRDDPVVVILNMTPVPRDNYNIGVPYSGDWEIVMNSDAEEFGGYSSAQTPILEAFDGVFHGMPYHLAVDLPGFSALFLKRKKMI